MPLGLPPLTGPRADPLVAQDYSPLFAEGLRNLSQGFGQAGDSLFRGALAYGEGKGYPARAKVTAEAQENARATAATAAKDEEMQRRRDVLRRGIVAESPAISDEEADLKVDMILAEEEKAKARSSQILGTQATTIEAQLKQYLATANEETKTRILEYMAGAAQAQGVIDTQPQRTAAERAGLEADTAMAGERVAGVKARAEAGVPKLEAGATAAEAGARTETAKYTVENVRALAKAGVPSKEADAKVKLLDGEVQFLTQRIRESTLSNDAKEAAHKAMTEINGYVRQITAEIKEAEKRADDIPAGELQKRIAGSRAALEGMAVPLSTAKHYFELAQQANETGDADVAQFWTAQALQQAEAATTATQLAVFSLGGKGFDLKELAGSFSSEPLTAEETAQWQQLFPGQQPPASPVQARYQITLETKRRSATQKPAPQPRRGEGTTSAR